MAPNSCLQRSSPCILSETRSSVAVDIRVKELSEFRFFKIDVCFLQLARNAFDSQNDHTAACLVFTFVAVGPLHRGQSNKWCLAPCSQQLETICCHILTSTGMHLLGQVHTYTVLTPFASNAWNQELRATKGAPFVSVQFRRPNQCL